jgi:hypothetical protein
VLFRVLSFCLAQKVSSLAKAVCRCRYRTLSTNMKAGAYLYLWCAKCCQLIGSLRPREARLPFPPLYLTNTRKVLPEIVHCNGFRRSRLSREIKALQQLLSGLEERRRSNAAASSPWGPSPTGIPPPTARSAGTNGIRAASPQFSFPTPMTPAAARTPGVHPTPWQGPPAASSGAGLHYDSGSGVAGAWAEPNPSGMERPRAEPSAVPSREVDFTVPRQFRSVDYSDGVQDPQWKRTDFPWRREIEVRVSDISCSTGIKSGDLIVPMMQICR